MSINVQLGDPGLGESPTSILMAGSASGVSRRAGVHWFQRVTAAEGRDAGSAFRGTLGALCPELLTGTLNHDARTEVGMHRSWCAAVPPPSPLPTARAKSCCTKCLDRRSAVQRVAATSENPESTVGSALNNFMKPLSVGDNVS